MNSLPDAPFFANIERYPVRITAAGEGAYVYDSISHRWLLDFWSDESVQGMGYGEPVNDALRAFIDSQQPHQLPDIFPSDIRTQLAQRLCDTYGYERIFFDNSGTEAIETAIKITRQYWSKQGKTDKKICVSLKGNFHGRTYGALALNDSYGTGSNHHKDGFEAVPGPDAWPGYQQVAADMPTIQQEVDPERTAALFLAPVEGNHLVRGYDPAFLRELHAWCKAYDVLLVFDEIQTGSGWTGYYSAAEMYDVPLPDIMTIGKRIAMGFPMTATMTSAEIAECIGLGQHFNTFAGSPFVCFMANRWLDWLENGGLEMIRINGKLIRTQLEAMPWITKVNQFGMMISLQPDYDNLPYRGNDLCASALEQGLLIVTHRRDKEVRYSPPCAAPVEQLERGAELLDNAHENLV